jgi:hypothetical protein
MRDSEMEEKKRGWRPGPECCGEERWDLTGGPSGMRDPSKIGRWGRTSGLGLRFKI